MRHLRILVRYIWRRQRWSMLRAMLLAAIVMIAGAALLGLSGWFISAAAVAGLAGTGAVFDVFRPSAGVRFLALGRTIGRYGERMLSHDATLRALAALRVAVLASMVKWPYVKTTRTRASAWLNRFTRDIDALDGLSLRLLIPLIAAASTVLFAVAMLYWLTSATIALLVLFTLMPGLVFALVRLARATRRPARLAHHAESAFRMRLIDLLGAQTRLVVSGRLAAQREYALHADRRAREQHRAIDRATRHSLLTGAVIETIVGASVVAIGLWLVSLGTLSAPLLALSFFVVLGLQEVFVPLHRGVADLSRLVDAARRVSPLIGSDGREVIADDIRTGRSAGRSAMPPTDGMSSLVASGASHRYPGGASAALPPFFISLRSGETVVLSGPSGAGKSTALLLLAGVLPPVGGEVALDGIGLAQIDPSERLRIIGLLGQRAALLSGSLRDALSLGQPGLTDEQAWAALDAVDLARVANARDGLDTRLGEAGVGLSGGEQRRLALARILVRRPRFLLLDEPTEGLDEKTAARVREGIRRLLPGAGILVASHRASDRRWADRVIHIKPASEPVASNRVGSEADLLESI